MPFYSFIHPETEETIELLQKMKEPHVYIDDDGIEWKRVWTLPNAAIDADIDPFDSKAFVTKTGNYSKGRVKYGDILDASKEMSEKRKEKNNGVDPVKAKMLKEYSEKRRNRPPPPWMTE